MANYKPEGIKYKTFYWVKKENEYPLNVAEYENKFDSHSFKHIWFVIINDLFLFISIEVNVVHFDQMHMKQFT